MTSRQLPPLALALLLISAALAAGEAAHEGECDSRAEGADEAALLQVRGAGGSGADHQWSPPGGWGAESSCTWDRFDNDFIYGYKDASGNFRKQVFHITQADVAVESQKAVCLNDASCFGITYGIISGYFEVYWGTGVGPNGDNNPPFYHAPGWTTLIKSGTCGPSGPALGRPYLVQGQSFLASSPAREGQQVGGWGALEHSLSRPAAQGGGLAARLLAEATRRALQVHGSEDVQPLIALIGTTAMPDEKLDYLIRTARQELSTEAPSELERWRGAGLNEHASVGSFAKLGMELMVAGAPPRLARLAARAQEEEVLHAHISLALGGAHEGGEILEFPEHKLELTRDRDALRRAAISEGLRGEGRASLELFDQAVGALKTRPAAAMLCWAMAVDESRHAELAEETLQWLQRAAGMKAPRIELGANGVEVAEVVQGM